MSETICRRCLHHKEVGDNGREIWYNNLCMAEPQPEPKRNFVTGGMKDPEAVYCRDRNTIGECAKFVSKSLRSAP